jgi:hypothetical protein
VADVALVGAYSGGDESVVVSVDAVPDGSGSQPVVYGTAEIPGQHDPGNTAKEIGNAKTHKTAAETKSD